MLERAEPFDIDKYPIQPEEFRGFRGVVIHYSWFHPEACRAAYIAEAAWQLADEEGFRKANDWLFPRNAKFTDEELTELANLIAVDVGELMETSRSEDIKKIVGSDIAEGISQGVSSTPFVCLNGVAIEVAASDPANVTLALRQLAEEIQRREQSGNAVTPRAADFDPRPPAASERVVELWRNAEPVASLRDPEASQYVFGDPDADDRVLLCLEPT